LFAIPAADPFILVEAKAASLKSLSDKSTEQAENYGSRSGVEEASR
jgi:hypothetical protein